MKPYKFTWLGIHQYLPPNGRGMFELLEFHEDRTARRNRSEDLAAYLLP